MTDTTYFGTMSLKSSIFRRPAGVSPIFMSMKTMGRGVDMGFQGMQILMKGDLYIALQRRVRVLVVGARTE